MGRPEAPWPGASRSVGSACSCSNVPTFHARRCAATTSSRAGCGSWRRWAASTRLEQASPLPITHSATYVDSACAYRNPIPFYGVVEGLPPHGYIIPRDVLDDEMLAAAGRAGAIVHQDTAVTGVRFEPGGVEIEAGRRRANRSLPGPARRRRRRGQLGGRPRCGPGGRRSPPHRGRAARIRRRSAATSTSAKPRSSSTRACSPVTAGCSRSREAGSTSASASSPRPGRASASTCPTCSPSSSSA